MKYAWIKNEDDSLVMVKDYPEDWDKSSVSHKFGASHAIRIIPVETDEDLEFNELTQKQVTERVIMATKVRNKKTIVTLTSDELDAIVDKESRKAKKEAIKANKETVKGWIESNDKAKFTELCQMFVDVIEALELDK
jgi:hypothetical protein